MQKNSKNQDEKGEGDNGSSQKVVVYQNAKSPEYQGFYDSVAGTGLEPVTFGL